MITTMTRKPPPEDACLVSRSPSSHESRRGMFSAAPARILRFEISDPSTADPTSIKSMFQPNPKTGTWEHRLLQLPPCSAVSQKGVPVLGLPLGTGGGNEGSFRLLNPDAKSLSSISLENPSTSAVSVSSTRLTTDSYLNYSETDLKRRISTILPRSCKDDYNSFASGKRSRFSRILHPHKYKRYLRGRQIVADHLKADDIIPDDVSPSVSSIWTDQRRQPRLQKSTEAYKRDIFNTIRSLPSRAKVETLHLTASGKRDSQGKPVRGKLRTRRQDPSVKVDRFAEPIDSHDKLSQTISQQSADVTPSFSGLWKRLIGRSHTPSRRRTRLTKKRSAKSVSSISVSSRLPNPLADLYHSGNGSVRSDPFSLPLSPQSSPYPDQGDARLRNVPKLKVAPYEPIDCSAFSSVGGVAASEASWNTGSTKVCSLNGGSVLSGDRKRGPATSGSIHRSGTTYSGTTCGPDDSQARYGEKEDADQKASHFELVVTEQTFDSRRKQLQSNQRAREINWTKYDWEIENRDLKKLYSMYIGYSGASLAA